MLHLRMSIQGLYTLIYDVIKVLVVNEHVPSVALISHRHYYSGNRNIPGGAGLKFLGFLYMNPVFYAATPGIFRIVLPAHLPRVSTLLSLKN